jgi:FolB domain-containing protein
MDQIIIKDLLARGIIGVNPEERAKTQDMLINIILFTDLRRAGQTDEIDHTVSYSTVARRVQIHAESAARQTVEALAEDIAQLCLEDSRVERVRVRVEKPGAVRFTRSVGVEIERSQSS